MAAAQRKLVHKQFNSPMGLYSQQNVKETLDRELKAFGTDGIEIDEQITKPLNLANSEVLRAVEAEEEMKCGYKRVAWPPKSEERIVREFTPQPQTQTPQGPYSNQPTEQQQQPGAAAPPQHQPQPQQQYRAPSYDQYQRQQTPQYNQQPQQQHQAPPSSNQYQQPPQQQQVPPQHYQQQPAQQQQQQNPSWAHNQPQQQPSWAHNQPQQHQQPQPQYQQQPQYQPQPQYQAPPPSHQYQTQPPQQQYQTEPQSNQYNSYSQPQQYQQQQHQPISQDQPDYQQLPQDYRGGSPGIITLRKETPISQKPAPVYNSQPAAISFQGGSSMRGDLKWPPPEYKEAAVKENEERRKLALGPVCRPRKVQRDYTTFFAKNALNCYYPSYKVPPGTQHMLS